MSLQTAAIRKYQPGDLVLGLDFGTQGVKIIVYDIEQKKIVAIGFAAYDNLSNQPNGWKMQRQSDWTRGLAKAWQRAVKHIDPSKIVAIALGAQMHGANFIDEGGKPLYPCIEWDDPRGSEENEARKDERGEHWPARWTGNRVDWFIAHEPELWEKTRWVMTPSTYIAYCLTGRAGVLPGDGEGMFGARNPGPGGGFVQSKLTAISPRLPEMVPDIGLPGDVLSGLNKNGARLLPGAPLGTPVAFPCGDQPVGTYGNGCVVAGSEISAQFGTSVVLNVLLDRRVTEFPNMVDPIADVHGGPQNLTCVTAGCQGYDGGVRDYLVAWTRGKLPKGKKKLKATTLELYTWLSHEAAKIPAGCGGVCAYPSFGGEGSLGRPDAFGSYIGLRRDTLEPGVKARALMESSCLLLLNGLNLMEVSGLKRIIASGGGMNDPVWPQIAADVLGAPIVIPECKEAVAMGAVLLAMEMIFVQSGELGSPAALCAEHIRYAREVQPHAGNHERYRREVLPAYLEGAKALSELYGYPYWARSA